MKKKRKSIKLKSKIKKVSNCDIKLQPIRKSAKYNHAKDRSANISVISNSEQSVLNDGAPSRKSSLVTKNCWALWKNKVPVLQGHQNSYKTEKYGDLGVHIDAYKTKGLRKVLTRKNWYGMENHESISFVQLWILLQSWKSYFCLRYKIALQI